MNKIQILSCALGLSAYGCAHEKAAHDERSTLGDEASIAEQPRGHAVTPRGAEATLTDAPGVTLEGKAELAEVERGVQIDVTVHHADPGTKGVHIHELGDCSDIPNKSMGEHFAPTANDHGLPTANEHHLGDLGNIVVSNDGTGRLTIVVPGASLKNTDPDTFLGKALVIHEKQDVGIGPAGESGNPIACGVITEVAGLDKSGHPTLSREPEEQPQQQPQQH